MAMPRPEKPLPRIAMSTCWFSFTTAPPLGCADESYIPVTYSTVTWITDACGAGSEAGPDVRRGAPRAAPGRDQVHCRAPGVPRGVDRGGGARGGREPADRVRALQGPARPPRGAGGARGRAGAGAAGHRASERPPPR